MRKGAFTLIELLVVIAIIALLVSILVPSLSAAREVARKAVCMTHLKNVVYGVNLYTQDSVDVMPPWFSMYSTGAGWYWADYIVKYSDSTARPIPISMGLYGSWWTVGNQNWAPNWTKNYAPANPIVYAPVLNCPSQTGKANNNSWHYAYTRTWQLNQNRPVSDSDPMKTKYGTMLKLKNPARFALICESGEKGGLSDMLSTSWYTGANYLINWLAVPAMHIGKTRNFGMAGGNVISMTDVEILSYHPVSKTPAAYNDFPFNIPQ